jgi:hypothetical protein
VTANRLGAPLLALIHESHATITRR